MGQCWSKWNATGHATTLTSMWFFFIIYLISCCLVACFSHVRGFCCFFFTFYSQILSLASNRFRLMQSTQMDGWNKHGECVISGLFFKNIMLIQNISVSKKVSMNIKSSFSIWMNTGAAQSYIKSHEIGLCDGHCQKQRLPGGKWTRFKTQNQYFS